MESTVTLIVEIVIDHQLPELVFIDEFHYKPMATKAILGMFGKMMEIEQEINVRLILQTGSPFISSTNLRNARRTKDFYDSLIQKRVTKRAHIYGSYSWMVYEFESDLVQRNQKEQLLFNVTSSTVFDESQGH